ncbi:MAG: preprotein translocase subunit YajC [Flavobacteriaceae bacterium]
MGDLGQFLPMLLIFVVAYFFMIRPQMKRAKDEKKFASELKRGDRVITKSGLHGKVMDLNDSDASVVLETMAGKLKFDRSAISMEFSRKLNAPVVEKK